MSSPRERDTTPPFPERVGRYELLLPLGTGGMATVFLARTRGVGGFERDVALKLLHAHLRGDEESKLHLLEEAKLAARIRHPNVVPVLEVDEDPFGLYLVMEYVEGETLAGLLAGARKAGTEIPARVAGRILSDALAGLHAAHELADAEGKALGLVHRDFSPQNILVGIDGIARLTDFGVAKAAGRAVRTKTGLVKGKVSYMAPEQARGHEVDRRCDVWAAGVVAWELIARRRLHDNQDEVATLLSVVTEEPPILSSVRDDVGEKLEVAVARALTSELDERCPSAAELKRDLAESWPDGLAGAEEVGTWVRRIVGPKLDKRSQRITELRQLRARMGEIARPEDSESTPSARGDDLAPGTGPPPGADPPPGAEPTTVRALPVATESSAERAEEATLQPLDSSAVLRAAERRSNAKRFWASAAVAAVLIAGLVGIFALGSAPEPAVSEDPPVSTATQEPAARTATEPKVTGGAVSEPGEAGDEVDRADEQREPSQEADDLEPAEPKRSVRTSKRAPPARPRSARPRSSSEKRALPRSQAPANLADNPYGGN